MNFKVEKIEELLKDFYYLTNIKICLYDSLENEIFYFPEKLSEFCKLLRENKEMDEMCKRCDKNAFSECKKTHSQYLYTCHAGLIECISPIMNNDEITGYIVVGQIKEKDKFTFDEIKKRINADAENKKLEKAYDKLQSTDIKTINAAIKILDACTGYEYLKSSIINSETRIDKKLSKFIDDNLTLNLDVSALCSKYRLSRSEIYLIFKEYFNSTPAEYIKSRRLYKAQELLKSTYKPINVIAKEVGIPDYNYFSKIFKRFFHYSPTYFRKENKH